MKEQLKRLLNNLNTWLEHWSYPASKVTTDRLKQEIADLQCAYDALNHSYSIQAHRLLVTIESQDRLREVYKQALELLTKDRELYARIARLLNQMSSTHGVNAMQLSILQDVYRHDGDIRTVLEWESVQNGSYLTTDERSTNGRSESEPTTAA